MCDHHLFLIVIPNDWNNVNDLDETTINRQNRVKRQVFIETLFNIEFLSDGARG